MHIIKADMDSTELEMIQVKSNYISRKEHKSPSGSTSSFYQNEDQRGDMTCPKSYTHKNTHGLTTSFPPILWPSHYIKTNNQLIMEETCEKE